VSAKPPFGALFVVPARGGSKGVHRKNIRCVNGVPLVVRAIRQAIEAAERLQVDAGRVVADTDDPEIADVAVSAGATVPFLREPAFAADETTSVDSTLRLLERLADLGRHADDLVLLQPTSPLRRAEDIVHCWQAYLTDRHSAVTVCGIGRPAAQLLHRGSDGRVVRACGAAPAATRRQDAPNVWCANGAVYCIAADVLRNERTFIVPGQTVGVPMPRWCSVDIDEPEDLTLADLFARLSDDETRKLP
jgi:CMP-N-acetylneuraminic acid synthetase